MYFPPIDGWLIAYLLPVLVVFGVIGIFSRRPGTAFRMIVIHGSLLISIVLSQCLLSLAHRQFPWHVSLISILLFMAATSIASVILGRFGFLYALSALIQQLTLTSMAYYLAGTFGFWLVVLLVVPIYAASHLLQPKNWQVKIPATLAWGVLSLALFALHGDTLLNASLHAIAGSILISSGILYPQSDFSIRRTPHPAPHAGKNEP